MLLNLQLSACGGFSNVKLLELIFKLFHLFLALLEIESVRSLVILFKGFLLEFYIFSGQVLKL